jgi:hypothetical protein
MSPRYTTLMASLPPLGRLFEAREPAISRLKLQSRLSLLHPQDRRRLEGANRILSQELVGYERDAPSEQTAISGRLDASLIHDAERFFRDETHPLLRQLVRQRLDLRTIVAALRRRHRGDHEPPRGQAWGFGSLVSTIERHWNEPSLGLSGVYPWIAEAAVLLENDDLIGMERQLFSLIWRELDRLGQGHQFNFNAVVIYLARWNLVERWSSYDAGAASERFRQLIGSAFADGHDSYTVLAS